MRHEGKACKEEEMQGGDRCKSDKEDKGGRGDKGIKKPEFRVFPSLQSLF